MLEIFLNKNLVACNGGSSSGISSKICVFEKISPLEPVHCIIILILLLLLASFRRMKIWSIDTQSFNHTAITKLDDLEEEKQ